MSETSPEKGSIPQDTLPPVVIPEAKPAVGWQTDPLPIEQQQTTCPHMGQIKAALQAGRYPTGAEWICACGQVFVVAANSGGKRTLRKQEIVKAEHKAAVETPVVVQPVPTEPPPIEPPAEPPVKPEPPVKGSGKTNGRQ